MICMLMATALSVFLSKCDGTLHLTQHCPHTDVTPRRLYVEISSEAMNETFFSYRLARARAFVRNVAFCVFVL